MITGNLGLSKQLKEAGYPQEAEKWWWEDNFGLEKNKSRTLQDKKPHNPKNGWVYFASPTADEILEQLPDKFYYKKDDKWMDLKITKIIDREDNYSGYMICYEESNKIAPLNVSRFIEKSLADAAAKMWLYLKENNLLEVKG